MATQHKSNMDYAALRRHILEECFQKQSTVEISRKLGFSFDKCRRWLNETKILKWDEFCDLAGVVGLDLDGAYENVKFINRTNEHPSEFFSFLKVKCGFETHQEVADYLCCHVSVVKRYALGNTIPDVDTIFKMIDYTAQLLPFFVQSLFSRNIKGPELLKLVTQDLPAMTYDNQHKTAMIEACLRMSSYEKRNLKTDEWLSKNLDLDIGEVRFLLSQMLDLKILTKKEDDFYEPTFLTTNIGLTFKEAIPFYQQLNLKLVDILEKKKEEDTPKSKPGLMIARVYATSSDSIEKVNWILNKAHSEILRVLENDEKQPETACCLMMQVYKVNKELDEVS